MVEDWLALPGDVAAEKTAAEDAAFDAVSESYAVPALAAPGRAEVVAVMGGRAAFAKAWRTLTKRQRLFLLALQRARFKHFTAVAATNRVIASDPACEDRTKLGVGTPSRWARDNEDYRLVLAALKADAMAQVTSREDLVLRAHRIAELAEEGEPVFGSDRDGDGQKIIGYEKKLDTALRANEQLMKATKVLGADAPVGLGGTGPALVIQVIQRDGALVDVTPKGVTIDLPGPSA